MAISIFQFVSISVAIVGLLFILESIIVIGGKGVDINGELPFMFFGTVFASFMPVILKVLGTWEHSWYWYIFIAFFMLMGFTAYIRSRGYTIRIFGGKLKSILPGIERALKLSRIQYEKATRSIQDGTETKYSVGEGKYPIVVTEKKKTVFFEAYIEVVAPEALWNKDLQYQLMAFVMTCRSYNEGFDAFRVVLRRMLIGIMTVILGVSLFF